MHSERNFPRPPARFPIPILTIDAKAAAGFSMDQPSLFIFSAYGLPIGQAYAEVGDLGLAEAAERALRTRAEPLSGSPGSVSVVICTRDRPEELARCLSSFVAQSLRADEIIVVDNASVDDRTRLAAEAAGAKYVREARPGLDIARNTGALAAVSNIVAYTDDDVVLHPDWLRNLVSAFDAPEIDAVTGLVLPAELTTEAQYIFESAWGFGKGYKRIDFDSAFYDRTRHRGCPAWNIGAGASMAFRREVFGRLGLFDIRLDVGAAGCSGDSEYWYRILHNGGICRYEPTAVAYHFHRQTENGLAKQITAYMRGHSAALLVQFERTRESGNILRLFLILPLYYTRMLAARLIMGPRSTNRFLLQQLRGCLEGIVYYFVHRHESLD
jgi:glycosyltransferase involved in cell wall biosynthesis